MSTDVAPLEVSDSLALFEVHKVDLVVHMDVRGRGPTPPANFDMVEAWSKTRKRGWAG